MVQRGFCSLLRTREVLCKHALWHVTSGGNGPGSLSKTAVELLPCETQVPKHQWIVQSTRQGALKASVGDFLVGRFTPTGKMKGKRNCWGFPAVQSKKLH